MSTTIGTPAAVERRTTQPRIRRTYELFEVTGLELEYAVVDGTDLRPRCLVEDGFRALAGRPASDVEFDDVGFSNELAAHVFEMKTLDPVRDLALAETALVRGLRRFAAVLRDRFGARLLPTGMHPFMRPEETHLWRGSGRAIYETYSRLFPIHQHGWLNVQSCQVNLPFGPDDASIAALHNAAACVLPYLPALAASSPLVEGRLGDAVCNRMASYATNQRRIPAIAGAIVPEYMTSRDQYRRDVLERIYRELDHVPGTARIRHEFVNSRGAILRFDRNALEIRVLDLQECVKMDVAMAVFARLAIKSLVGALRAGSVRLPEHALLVEDYRASVAAGRQAEVQATHILAAAGYRPGAATAETVLLLLLDLAHSESGPGDAPYLRLVEHRIRHGNLSEMIRRGAALERRGADSERQAAILGVYEELAGCLDRNEPWMP
jgi:carboxylate-amine ligase